MGCGGAELALLAGLKHFTIITSALRIADSGTLPDSGAVCMLRCSLVLKKVHSLGPAAQWLAHVCRTKQPGLPSVPSELQGQHAQRPRVGEQRPSVLALRRAEARACSGRIREPRYSGIVQYNTVLYYCTVRYRAPCFNTAGRGARANRHRANRLFVPVHPLAASPLTWSFWLRLMGDIRAQVALLGSSQTAKLAARALND